jgi:riboflavin transporter FmnP
MAILTALSVVLVAIIHFPIFPAVSFLEYDPADIPILICGFAFGPWAGLGFTVSAASGIYGIIMHILATGVYVTVSSVLYKHKKTKKEAILSLVAGTIAMAVVMFGANLVITPYFMMGAVNRETVGAVLSLMPFIIGFNLIKAGINGTVTFFVYKKVSPILKKDRRKG